MAKLHGSNRRRYLRFNPNAAEIQDLQQKSMVALAHVDLYLESEDFHPTILGLLVDQSHAGCSVVLIQSKNEKYERLEEGAEVSIKAGALHPMRAVVRWRKELDEDLLRIGFQFME